MLSIQNLQVRHNDLHLIDIPEWKLQKKGLYVITGANGSGKTSLLKKLSSYLSQYENDTFKGQICSVSALHLYERKLPMTGKEFYHLYNTSDAQIANDPHFSQLFSKFITEMSSGEFQALVLLSTLSSISKIFILDEPFSHLSQQWIHLFAEKIKKLAQEHLVIVVTHNVNPFSNFKMECFEIKDKKMSRVNDGI